MVTQSLPQIHPDGRRASTRRILAWVAPFAFLLTFGCGSTGNYVWYYQLPKSDWGVPADQYVIGAGDAINVSVYQQTGMDFSLKVRRDGFVAFPLIGEVRAVGKTPAMLAREIEEKLKVFVVSPRVTVNVTASNPIQVALLGEIGGKGTLSLEPPAQLVQAIAQAGGLGDYANESRIFVLRQFPKFQRIRFTLQAVMNNERGAATFPLRTGDVIMVE